MRPSFPGVPWPAHACTLLLLCAACGTTEFDALRVETPPATPGEAFFGVLCDRMGALRLPEDLSGASYHHVCHRTPEGGYAAGVDTALLPAPTKGAVDADGRPVSAATRRAAREDALTRLEALARQRPRVVAALDALFPDTEVPVRDLGNPDASRTCDPATPDRARLHDELAALLGRMTAMYGDGTLPDTTQALGAWLEDLAASPEATRAWAELDARQGYHPPERVLGLLRPLLAYPKLRDVLDTTTRAVGPTPTPGLTRAAFTSLLEVAHHELRTLESEPVRAPLSVTRDPVAWRDVLSRPRTGAELLSTLLLTEAGPAPSGVPVLTVRRDARGVAAVTSPGLPFADANADGLPDVDALGRFIPGSTAPVHPPFSIPGTVDTAERDAEGRVRSGPDNTPLYAYVDARHTLLGQVLSEARPLLAVDAAHPRSTVMELLDGLPVLLGPRDGAKASTREYAPVTVAYDAFRANEAPVLDLLHAGAQLLGQPSADDTLALLRSLVADHPGEVARLVALLQALSRSEDAHPEAELKAGNTFRDDLVDVAVELAREPGLLEDLLKALAQPESLALGKTLTSYLEHRDAFSYDRQALNGPPMNLSTGGLGAPRTPADRTQPDAGANRSLFQRFLNVLHDANGVAYCNKAGAVVHARGVALGDLDLPLFGGTYRECEVFKIDNMAVFYLQSIVGKARLYLRPSILRNGIAGIGAATVSVMEQSSGITGFWTPGSSRDLRPRPEWVNRMLVFDQVNDSPTPRGKNHITHRFLKDLQGQHLGSSVCTERVINDPDPGAVDAAPDGRVRGLRTCPEGEWFLQRTPDTMMMLETEGFYTAIRPLLLAFTQRNREDLLIKLVEVLHRHWMTERSPERECRLTRQPGDTQPMCSQAGASRYEPLLAEVLRGDAMGSVQALVQRLQALRVPHCTAVDAATRRCTRAESWDGVRVLAELARTVIDPARAGATSLTDRRGNAMHLRQDGITRAQVTPLSLLIDASSAMDDAFDRHAAEHPRAPDRRTAWERALSRLSDQFLTVQGERAESTFSNPLLSRLLPPALDVLRSELHARCPDTFTPPYARCAWMRDTLIQDVRDTLGGPLFATGWDFLEAARQDAALRARADGLTGYLLDPASPHEAWPTLLGASVDVVQWLASDGRRRVPLAHLTAGALRPDDLVDAALVLGRRVAGKAYTEDGATQVCAREMDPNELMSGVLMRLVTPTAIPGEARPRTPWEVLTEAVADVQRVVPGHAEARSPEDYQRIGRELASFLLDPEHGLERFYAVANRVGGAP